MKKKHSIGSDWKHNWLLQFAYVPHAIYFIVGWQATQKCNLEYPITSWIFSPQLIIWCRKVKKCNVAFLNLQEPNEKVVKKIHLFMMYSYFLNHVNKPLFGVCQPTITV